MDLTEKVSGTIRKYRMLSGGEKILIGLSGGPDSVCLTAILKQLAQKLNLSLHAIYIDHGLRPEETPEESRFCEDFCKGLEIPFDVEFIDVQSFAKANRLNKQEAARELRYHVLQLKSKDVLADKIALGHTLDDQIETFLMRVIRGSGMRGLSGIPPVRGNIIRPLIEVGRDEIETLLHNKSIGFVVDSSNLEDHYFRNRVRSTLIPVLKELDPDVMKGISHTTEVFREEDQYLEFAVNKAMIKLISRKTDLYIELFLMPLETMDKVLLRRILRRSVEETKGLRGIGLIHIEDIIGLIQSGKPGDRITLPKGIRAVKQYSTILITSEPPKSIGEYALDDEGELFIKEANLVFKASISDIAEQSEDKMTVILDAAKAPFPLVIRKRQDGDFFYPAGFGKKKKLQDFFVDEKVPRDERDLVPIIVSGNDIAWVAGYRPDERFSVTEKTKSYLVLRLIMAKT